MHLTTAHLIFDALNDLGFDSRWEKQIFLVFKTCTSSLGPTLPHIQWVPGVISLGVNRPGREL